MGSVVKGKIRCKRGLRNRSGVYLALYSIVGDLNYFKSPVFGVDCFGSFLVGKFEVFCWPKRDVILARCYCFPIPKGSRNLGVS